MKKEITTLDEKANLKQSNNLVEAKYRLTTYEQRMVIAICSQLRNETDLPKIHVKINDLADFCKFPSSKKLDMVRTTARKLRGRTLEYLKPNGKWYITGWINSADLLEDGTIEFAIDEKLKPHLLQLKSAYLLTPAAPLMEFKCDYSARLYFLLKKMIKLHIFEYDLDYIRERFQLSKSYSIFFNLKRKVLEPALQEINEKSDITVDHEYVKEGKATKKIRFKVEKKEKSPEEKLEEIGRIPLPLEKTKKKNKELDEDQKSVLKNLIDRGVSAEQAERIARKHSVARIRRNVALAVKQKDTAKNLPGLIIKFIKEDIAGQNEKAKIELEKEKKTKAKDRKQARELFHGQPAETLTDSKGNVLQYDEPVKVKL